MISFTGTPDISKPLSRLSSHGDGGDGGCGGGDGNGGGGDRDVGNGEDAVKDRDCLVLCRMIVMRMKAAIS